MKQSISLGLVSAFTILVIAAATGCSTKAKSPAIGNWRGEDGKQTVEFRRDGTLRGVDPYGTPLTGSFEFVDAEHVRIKINSSSVDRQTGTKMVDNAEGLCRLEVQGNSLTLVEEDGTVSHYSRTR